jgi:predicted membrane protein
VVLVGVFAMRWNVVVGGQSFSKTLHGYTPYHLQIWGIEGLVTCAFLLILPFVILFVLTKIIPPWESPEEPTSEEPAGKPLQPRMRQEAVAGMGGGN